MKDAENRQIKWYQFEALLWDVLFLILIKYFQVVTAIREADISLFHRAFLYTSTAYFIGIIVLEPLLVWLFSTQKIEKASGITFVLIFLLPFWWMIILYQKLHWFSILLTGNFFMCVIMWPLTCKLIDNILIYTIIPLMVPVAKFLQKRKTPHQ